MGNNWIARPMNGQVFWVEKQQLSEKFLGLNGAVILKVTSRKKNEDLGE